MSKQTTILICEDDKTDLLIFKKHLGSAIKEYEILEATNEEKINDFISNRREDIKIIFLDYFLPMSTGIEWLRLVSETNFAPVVMLTGHGDEETAVEALKEGAFDYIPKHKLLDYDLNKLIRDTISRWQVEKERDQLLGIAAHELRGPLAVILGYAELLNTYDNLSVSQIKSINEIIYERSQHLAELIDKLLDLNRIERGRIELKKAPHNLNDFLQKLIHQYKIIASKKNISLHLVEYAPGIICNCDIKRIEEVVSNIVDNAIKYSFQNTSVEITLRSDNEKAIIEVKDQGEGIQPDELGFLFDMFSSKKISTQPTAGEASHGLGLAICKKIIDLHQGNIEVMSTPGKGSIFTIILPLS